MKWDQIHTKADKVFQNDARYVLRFILSTEEIDSHLRIPKTRGLELDLTLFARLSVSWPLLQKYPHSRSHSHNHSGVLNREKKSTQHQYNGIVYYLYQSMFCALPWIIKKKCNNPSLHTASSVVCLQTGIFTPWFSQYVLKSFILVSVSFVRVW